MEHDRLRLVKKDSSLVRVLSGLEDGLLRRWWAGEALRDGDKRVVECLITWTRENGCWIECRCRGDERVHPLLGAMRYEGGYTLRRLTKRDMHRSGCTFEFEKVGDVEGGTGGTGSAANTGMPSFCNEESKGGLIESRGHRGERREGRGESNRLPAIARRLYWLATEAGCQELPKKFSSSYKGQIYKLALEKQVKPGLMLSQVMFADYRAFVENWFRGGFEVCKANKLSPAVWWVQLVVNGTDTSIEIDDGYGMRRWVEVCGEIKVFGGDKSAKRFPMLGMCLVKPSDKGGFHGEIKEVFLQPVYARDMWMLLDSDYERKTLTDLREVCGWLAETKQIRIRVHKPLFEWESTGERPDFVLQTETAQGQSMVVETMGYDEIEYESRKQELASRVGCAVYFDRRWGREAAGPNMELMDAVADWAMGRAVPMR